MMTSTYHPQTNGQCERFNRTILAAIRTYVTDHATDWDHYAQTFAYAYDTQLHSSTEIKPFDLVLSKPPAPLATESKRQPPPANENAYPYVPTRQRWLRHIAERVQRPRSDLQASQARYKRNYDARMRRRLKKLQNAQFVFLRIDKSNNPVGQRHKLAPVASAHIATWRSRRGR